MITDQEAIAIKRAVRRLIRAEIDLSWTGRQDPIYHADIKSERVKARATLASLLSPKTQQKKS